MIYNYYTNTIIRSYINRTLIKSSKAFNYRSYATIHSKPMQAICDKLSHVIYPILNTYKPNKYIVSKEKTNV